MNKVNLKFYMINDTVIDIPNAIYRYFIDELKDDRCKEINTGDYFIMKDKIVSIRVENVEEKFINKEIEKEIEEI